MEFGTGYPTGGHKLSEPIPVAIIGTLDTKGPEVAYIRELFHRLGQPSLVIDSGILGKPGATPDITREEVAIAAGTDLVSVQNSGSRGHAVEIMARGLAAIVRDLYSQGRIRGVFGIGGAEGGLMAAHAAQQLPLGAPKLIVSPSASGKREFGPFVGTSDMMMMHSVIDILGLNYVSKTVFESAVAAMIGMLRFARPIATDSLARVGITMLGQTTPGVMALTPILEAHGCEPIIYHANGIGGPAMDKLIDQGVLTGVIEYTVSEFANSVRGGIHETDENRGRAAILRGLPLVLVPGAGDFFNQGAVEHLDPKLQSRQHYRHNPVATLVRLNEEESTTLGQMMCQRIADHVAPVTIMIPRRGLSLIGVEGEPIHNQASDNALFTALIENAPADVPVMEFPYHVNQPEFAEAVANEFLRLCSLDTENSLRA